MSVCGRLFLLLILGQIFREGNCEVDYEEKDFNDTVLQVACSLDCPDFQEPCITNCTRTKQIQELDEEAGADIRLVCRHRNNVVLAYNPGIFVMKYITSDGTWGYLEEQGSTAPPTQGRDKIKVNLEREVFYQFRFYRISTNGISMPEITEWMKRLPARVIDRYTPKPVTKVTWELIKPTKNSWDPRWMVKISFSPGEDPHCNYKVTCQQVEGLYNRIAYLVQVEDFSVTFEELPFAANFKVSIKSVEDSEMWNYNDFDMDGSETIETFSTPRCLTPKYPSTCLLGAVKGLNATATHKTGNIFDVAVTWDEPDNDSLPLRYHIDLQPITARTEDWVSMVVDRDQKDMSVFRNVTILDQYVVYIRGSNFNGKGPTTSRRFTVGLKRIAKESDSFSWLHTEDSQLPIYLTGSILMMIIGIGIAACGYYRRRKRRLNKGTPVDEFEMNPDRLTITRVLGTGAFGVVKLASLCDNHGNVLIVAVKMLQDDSNENERRNFLHEIEIMKAMDEHPNIVSLLGCNTTGPYPFLVVEYCSRGDLQSFLRKSLEKANTLVGTEAMKCIVPAFRSSRRKEILKANSISFSVFRNKNDYVQAGSCTDEQDTSSDSEVVTMMDMLNFGRQIATGMEFLSSSRVVHRDLASRNILVCCDRSVKISDFGLSRDVYEKNIYKKSGNGREPLKWMAIESLTHQLYTTCSDVWSFGVLLWEIVTRGGDPYPGVPTIEILNQLHLGYRMVRPASCSIPLYNVMLSCWQTRPRDRPTFTILRQELDKLICTATNNEYFDLNDIAEESPPEAEDTQVPGPRPTSCSLQVAIATNLEPRIIIEVQEVTTDEPEKN